MTGNQLAALISDNHAELLERETRNLVLACAWADLHDLDPDRAGYQPLVERACVWGGEGTPPVSEYAAIELGALQGVGMIAGRALIADALDLRHRLPRLWRQVEAGQVRAWQARHVAQATRTLSWDAAGEVDDAVSGYLGSLPWPRFQKILTAAILQADPEQAQERAERARHHQDVWATDNEDGLKLLLARATSGDVTWFLATTNRIADILQREGDTSPIGARRARAIGLLARPADALHLLLTHRNDPTDLAEPASDGDRDQQDQPEREDKTEREDETEREDVRNEMRHQSLNLTPPAGFDPAAARPRVVLYFHLADTALHYGQGLVRPEHGDPLTLDELRDFLAGTGCHVRVQPVLDPAAAAPVDSYEIPTRTRTSIRLRNPVDVFPYGSCTSATMDDDHTIPYQPPGRGGPPGQTAIGNLGPVSRASHRALTHGGWSKRQPSPGTYVYRSPHGHIYVVTNHGTLTLGTTPFATHVWRVAQLRDDQQTIAA